MPYISYALIEFALLMKTSLFQMTEEKFICALTQMLLIWTIYLPMVLSDLSIPRQESKEKLGKGRRTGMVGTTESEGIGSGESLTPQGGDQGRV